VGGERGGCRLGLVRGEVKVRHRGGGEKAHDTARRRRGGSAFNLDVRAVDGDAWRGRDASGRNRGRRGLGTQRVAGQVADAGGERRHGEKTERRWR